MLYFALFICFSLLEGNILLLTVYAIASLSWLYHSADFLINELNKSLAHAHRNLNEGHIFFLTF